MKKLLGIDKKIQEVLSRALIIEETEQGARTISHINFFKKKVRKLGEDEWEEGRKIPKARTTHDDVLERLEKRSQEKKVLQDFILEFLFPANEGDTLYQLILTYEEMFQALNRASARIRMYKGFAFHEEKRRFFLGKKLTVQDKVAIREKEPMFLDEIADGITQTTLLEFLIKLAFDAEQNIKKFKITNEILLQRISQAKERLKQKKLSDRKDGAAKKLLKTLDKVEKACKAIFRILKMPYEVVKFAFKVVELPKALSELRKTEKQIQKAKEAREVLPPIRIAKPEKPLQPPLALPAPKVN